MTCKHNFLLLTFIMLTLLAILWVLCITHKVRQKRLWSSQLRGRNLYTQKFEGQRIFFSYFILFLLSWPCLQHMEVPWPGTETKPQQWQFQILGNLADWCHQETPAEVFARKPNWDHITITCQIIPNFPILWLSFSVWLVCLIFTNAVLTK